MDTNKFAQINSSSFSQMSTVLSMFLDGKEVDISSLEVKVENWGNFVRQITGNFVQVEASLSEGISGNIAILMKAKDAGVISNLVMGGEGEAQDSLSELDLTAMQETMSQMLSSYASGLSSVLSKKVFLNIQDIKLQPIAPSTPTFSFLDKSNFILNKFVLKIDTLVDSEMYQLLPSKVAQDMIEDYKKEEEKPAEMLFDLKDLEGIDIATPSPKTQEEAKIKTAVFSELQPRDLPAEIANIELIMDVPLNITVELGRAKMSIQEVLELSPGSVVELDKLDGEPVDVLANGRLVAKGEVVVIGETFGVRVIEILSPQERMKKVRD